MAGTPPTTPQVPRGARADSQAVLNAAIAQLPPEVGDESEVLPPTAADRAVEPEPQYEFDDDAPAGDGAQPVAPGAGAPPQASTPGATGEQPLPIAAAPAAPAAPASSEPDPWAETEDVEYTDGDTGDKFVVRAPKTYASKVKNGYARRSVMDRTTGFMSRHRALLEPIIANKQFDDIAPVIDLGMRDPDFARFVAQAHARRMAGLPLDMTAYQAPQAQTPAPAAQQYLPHLPPQQAAPQGVETREQIVERLKGEMIAGMGDVDEYTRDTVVNATMPMLRVQAQMIENQQRQEITQRTSSEQQRAQKAAYDRQFQVARQGRQLIMSTFPDEYNEQTPPDKWQRIVDYMNSSDMIRTYGEAPGTFLLAAQALRSPMGLAGIGRTQAPSVAAESIADIQRRSTALATAATAGVARATAPGSPGGSPGDTPAKPPRAPRFVKDPRHPSGRRPITPKELGEWLNKNPSAM